MKKKILCILVLFIVVTISIIMYKVGKNMYFKSYMHNLMKINPEIIIMAVNKMDETNNKERDDDDIIDKISDLYDLEYHCMNKNSNSVKIVFKGKYNFVGGYNIHINNGITNVSYFDNNLDIVKIYELNGTYKIFTNEIYLFYNNGEKLRNE